MKMTPELFEIQFNRLKTQWPNSYGPERQARIWSVFKHMDSLIFGCVVDRAIDTCRSAPLVEDLSKIELQIKEEHAKNRYYDDLKHLSFAESLEAARYDNKTADPKFVLKCLETLDEKFRHKITPDKFDDKCKELDAIASKKR